uniref:Glutathione peroxidase n=2 Tax=Callorhinchus milii TaxID=7868 RepID=A0A4W3JXX9_CALMI
MNELQSRYSREGFAVLGFPCNQFGFQENVYNEEILNSLKYVRPGKGFEPNFQLTRKIEVNGDNEDPIFTFLKAKLPRPADGQELLIDQNRFIVWNPVSRNDVGWNFEKFLIDRDGEPYKRYSNAYFTIDLAEDIEFLLQKV